MLQVSRYYVDMYKVKTQAWTRWTCCHCKSCKTKLEHENKTFYCRCCIAAAADAGRCCPERVTDYRAIEGETRGAAWTHDRWWLHAAEQCCPVFLRKFSGMVPTLHGDRLSKKALELESVLRRIIIIMSTEKSCKVTLNTIIS